MKKQTAVEWLFNTLETYGSPYQLEIEWDVLEILISQAKAIEREQLLEFGSRVTDRWGLTKVEKIHIEDEFNKVFVD